MTLYKMRPKFWPEYLEMFSYYYFVESVFTGRCEKVISIPISLFFKFDLRVIF